MKTIHDPTRKWPQWMRMAAAALCLSALMPTLSARAAMQQRTVDWTVDGQAYSGVLIFDDRGDARRPGVVMVPNWRGINASAIEKATQLAGEGYVVLVADMYGKTNRPASNEQAAALVRPLMADRTVLRRRAAAALDALRQQAAHAPLDATRIGAVGFCFGGSTVLEMARAGLPLAGVVSLHGGLSTSVPAAPDSGAIPPILVLNGAADRSVSTQDITGFAAEMDAAGADWQFVNFSGAVHCFAESDANSPPNCLYHPQAARRAWRMMDDFLYDVLDG